jgi:hypothetical protein
VIKIEELTQEQIRQKIDGMVWSFSRLSSFHNCPYEWRLKYIEGLERDNSYYGALGGFSHEVLEKFFKEELSIFDCGDYFEQNYMDKVPYDAPPNPYVDLKEKDYNLILDYFQNINFPFEDYEILGVEKEIKFKVDKYEFIGYIDLLLRDKNSGKIILVDHKSSHFDYLKKGGVSKKNQEQFDKYKKQLYLYSIPIYEEYGEYPEELRWNMFKDQQWLTVKFDENEYKETQEWAINEIHTIEDEMLYLPNTSDSNSFYCRYLCGASYCPYRK